MQAIENLMRRYTIRVRMLGAIAVVLLLALVGGVGLYGMSRMQAVNEHFAQRIVSEAQLLGELRRYENDMINGYQKPAAALESRDKQRASVASAQQPSLAAVEQSSGIGQVGSAVSDLDQMTQQNAALVEQSAAAAGSLKSQAQRLSGLVGTFRLEAGATPA